MKQEEAKKQLILKLCNAQQSAEKTENELKGLRYEHEKALKMIQEFISRQQKSEDKQIKKDKKIVELQQELHRKSSDSSRSGYSSSGHSITSRRQIKTEMDDNQAQQVQQVGI